MIEQCSKRRLTVEHSQLLLYTSNGIFYDTSETHDPAQTLSNTS